MPGNAETGLLDRFVHYGCGPFAPASWRNFDASPTLRLQRLPVIGRLFAGGEYPVFPPHAEYGDIIKGLPVAAGSCQAIYCSHVLEHLSLRDLQVALANTCAYLRPGGRFRLVVPDLEPLAREYVESDDPRAAIRFVERTGLGRETRPTGLRPFLRGWLGNAAHLWMWDRKSMAMELEQAGFREIRRARIGDSAEPRFADVEDPDRWRGCLGMECRK